MPEYLIKYKTLNTVIIKAESTKEATELFTSEYPEAFFISAEDVGNKQMEEIEIYTPDNKDYFLMTLEELRRRGYDCEPLWEKESLLFRNTTANKTLEELKELNVYGRVIACKQREF